MIADGHPGRDGHTVRRFRSPLSGMDAVHLFGPLPSEDGPVQALDAG